MHHRMVTMKPLGHSLPQSYSVTNMLGHQTGQLDKTGADYQQSQYNGLSTILLSFVVAAIVISAGIVFAAVLLYKKRRRSSIYYDGHSAKAAERGSILLRSEKTNQNLNFREIDFTVPFLVGHFPPLSLNRRVLSTPDLGQYEASEDSLSLHSGPLNTVPVFPKQYSIDSPNSLGRCSLGTLDPELYKATDSDDDLDFPDGHIGRVWFTLEYQKDLERLVVNLIKIKNLPSRVAGSISACDPVIRLCLLPDERCYLQSRQKQKTCNPRIDQSFCFQVSHKCLDERLLKISVFDVDRQKKFKVIGHVLYPLKDLDLTVEDKLFLTRDLSRSVTESPSFGHGEIFISLCYNDNIGRLTVAVFQAKGLPKVSDTYVKVSFLQHNKAVKCKKTSTVKQSPDPIYNESFTFKASALETASVVLHLMEVSSGHGKDVIVGRVALGSYMFARGRALEHWNDMLSNCREQLRRWHHLQP